ncbi:MAG: hypothetical protein JWP04_1040 [Belnapia sp.]|nr:hypothetical protein [Belnapia sp.]
MDQAAQVGLQQPRIAPDGTPNLLLSALPPGWRLLGRSRFGTAGPVGPSSGCHALAHPAIGVALVDIAPNATPNAEARLRRVLAAENFWQSFPGTLPVWHGRIEIGAVRALPGLLAEGFGTLPPLTVPGRESWIAAAQVALALDAGWEVPGRSPPPRAAPAVGLLPDEADDEPPRRRRLSTLKLGGAVAGSLVLVGILLLVAGGPGPAPEPPASLTAMAPAPIAALAPEAAAAQVMPAEPQPEAAATAVQPPVLPPIERVTLPMPQPEPRQQADAEAPPTPSEPAAPAPLQAAVLALPPPAPPPPPLRRASTAPPRIDPACTRAAFRYQQGLALNATEAAHVRNGCATRR